MKENCLQAKIKWKTKSWMEIQVVLKFYHWAETMLWFWVWHVSELIISSMILLWDMQLQAHMNILKRLKDRKDKLWCLVSYLNDNSIIKIIIVPNDWSRRTANLCPAYAIRNIVLFLIAGKVAQLVEHLFG